VKLIKDSQPNRANSHKARFYVAWTASVPTLFEEIIEGRPSASSWSARTGWRGGIATSIRPKASTCPEPRPLAIPAMRSIALSGGESPYLHACIQRQPQPSCGSPRSADDALEPHPSNSPPSPLVNNISPPPPQTTTNKGPSVRPTRRPWPFALLSEVHEGRGPGTARVGHFGGDVGRGGWVVLPGGCQFQMRPPSGLGSDGSETRRLLRPRLPTMAACPVRSVGSTSTARSVGITPRSTT
jgi:hypothetical protein